MKSMLFAFALTALVTYPAAGAVLPSGPDHYLCYKAALAKGQPKFPKGVTKSLEDRFGGPQTFDVKKITDLQSRESRWLRDREPGRPSRGFRHQGAW